MLKFSRISKSPYFNRTYRHFCSHRNTPSSGKLTNYPAVIKKDNIIYMAHNIFEMYSQHGAKLHRDLIENCLKLLVPEQTVTAELPSCGTITLLKQTKTDNYILNLLYAVPIKTRQCTGYRRCNSTLQHIGNITFK